MTANERIRVLVVDDSAFARKVIREVLARDVALDVVGIARDGLEALEKINELRPDVVTLDLLMPDLDGVGLLKALPKENPPKIVIVSVSGADSDLAIEALQLGAVDLVTKPTPLATDRLYELSNDLAEKVKAAAHARPRVNPEISQAPWAMGPAAKAMASQRLSPAATDLLATRLLVIGTSTGGPQALTQLFRALPAEFPVPVMIALHIPDGYTSSLAARLSQLGGMKVEEAFDGMELRAGHAALAPGGKHLMVKARDGRLYASVSRVPESALHHPSVDVLFESAAREVGSEVIALVMTGMGDDGLKGARAIREKGGRIFAESSSSCIVYGMPRSIIDGGMASGEAPLERLPALLMESIFSGSGAAFAELE